MKITKATFRKVALGLTRPYTIAYKTVDNVAVIAVELHTAEGLVGYGASNPSKPVVGENVDETIAVLQEKGLDWLENRDIRHFRGLLQENRKHFAQHAGAAAAVDIALHDLFGKMLQVPLAEFLGCHFQKMPTSITIGIKSLEETLTEAAEYYGRGFRYLKVKLGQNLEEDIERLAKLRETYGQKIHIRVDANQGYKPSEVEGFYHKTLPFDLELIEQPVSVADNEALRQLPEQVRQAIAADESLVAPADALRLAMPPSPCGIFNIKLMKCGGIDQGLQIAKIAELANLDLMWGCNDESIISICAALHAAFSSPNTRYIDLDGSLDLARDLVSGGFLLKDGEMMLSGMPGLGFEKAVDLA